MAIGKVAVTGAGGRLGAILVTALREAGVEVVGIDMARPSSQFGNERMDLVDTVCDLSRPLGDIIAEGNPLTGCSVVVHLAAAARCSDPWEVVRAANVDGVVNVCDLAKEAKVKRVVFASTNHTQNGAIMGPSPEALDTSRLNNGFHSIRISDPSAPDSLYAVTKLFGENLGHYRSTVLGEFEFVALRIGFCHFDSAAEWRGLAGEQYLRSMWLSQRDFVGFFRGAMTAHLDTPYFAGYAVSNNSQGVFDISETVATLGYCPLDSSDTFFSA